MSRTWEGKCDFCGKEANFFHSVIEGRKIKQICHDCYIKYVKVKENVKENAKVGSKKD